jgi:hypothetical protein
MAAEELMSMKRLLGVRGIAVVLMGAISGADLAGTFAAEGTAVDIRIDASQRLQQIDGFGSGAFGGFTLFERGYCDAEFPQGVTYQTTPEQRKAMITTAVRELGVTHLRIWLCPSGIEQTNDNDDPEVMNWDAFTWEGNTYKPLSDKPNENRRYGLKEWGDLLTTAVPLGLKNWIVTPGWLEPWLQKKFADESPDRFAEYAEWAAAHLLYLKKTFGLEAPYWSMGNEPDVIGWKSPEMWVPWINATGRRFRKEGLKTKIMVPDFMNVYEAVPLTRAILADNEAWSYIGALAYHHYRSSFDDPKPFLDITSQPETADEGKLYDRLTGGARAMADLGRQYGLPSWETETAYYPAPLKEKKLTPWDIARGRANEIYYELTSGASAVAGMLMIWVDAIDPRYDYTVRMSGHHIVMTTDGKRVTEWAITKDCGVILAHYGRYVRPGDYRVSAACEDRLIRVTAFATRQDRRYVAVVINNSRQSRTIRLDLQHLPFEPRFAGGLLTDENRAMAPRSVKAVTGGGHAYETTLTPLSVCTIVWAAEPGLKLELPEGLKIR